jgi:hypothetical protein
MARVAGDDLPFATIVALQHTCHMKSIIMAHLARCYWPYTTVVTLRHTCHNGRALLWLI